METIDLKGNYAFYDTEHKKLIPVGGGITFGKGGNPTLKLYNSGFWHELKHRIIAREVGVCLDIAREAWTDYSCRNAHWHTIKHPDIIRDHANLFERVGKLLFKDQDIVIKVAVDSIIIDPKPVK
ncbi:hypothetical protein OPFAMLBM_00120 [Aeromonas phage avDM12-TAAL]|nr:hypothetical protein OPFAMLBM_00120 [Aeromonas phage avDM12-TAAL]